MASQQSLRRERLGLAYPRDILSVPNVSNVNKNTNKNDKNSEKNKNIKQLARLIKEHLKKHKTYHFRPVKIDGICCYVVIHSKYKIVNFESINVKCLINKNNRKKKQAYSLFYMKYKSVEQALHKIENIVANYKIYNGDLVSPESYIQLKLEETILPYNDEQVCSVCKDNTTDITVCKHYICFHCREQCVLTNNTNCPVCRNEEIVNIYNTDNGMINNNSYPILEYALDYENDNTTHHFINLNEDSDNDSDDGSVNGSDNETIINMEDNEEHIQQEQNDTIELVIDRQGNTGNITILGIHDGFRENITDAFNLITTNITRRNREIIEFNNNWGGSVYNDINNVVDLTTENNVFDISDSSMELSFTNEQEDGEEIEDNETNNEMDIDMDIDVHDKHVNMENVV